MPPIGSEFVFCLNTPKTKTAGMDHVPPHLLGWLPEYAQWILHQHIFAVGATG